MTNLNSNKKEPSQAEAEVGIWLAGCPECPHHLAASVTLSESPGFRGPQFVNHRLEAPYCSILE